MDLDNQYYECLYLIFLKTFLIFFQIENMKNKKVFKQSTVNDERDEEAKKVEKNKYMAEKSTG